MEMLLEGRTALFNRVSGRVGSLRLSYFQSVVGSGRVTLEPSINNPPNLGFIGSNFQQSPHFLFDFRFLIHGINCILISIPIRVSLSRRKENLTELDPGGFNGGALGFHLRH